MYVNPTWTIQFPEVKAVIQQYYSRLYDHNNLIKNRHDIQERFIENFVSWFNKGHFKVKGLKDFKYIYITTGVSESINMAITEHRLRPEVVSDDYPGYIAQYLMIRKAGIRCTNNTPFISLPFYDTADEHPQTQSLLEQNTFVDLAWAGGSGLKKTYDLSKVGYVAFSFSKMYGIQFHRVGILFSKKPIKTLEMFKTEAYVNLAGVDLVNQLMSFSPSYFYDKYRGKADEICKRLNLDTTPSLWFGRKDNKKVPLLNEWLKI